MSATASSIDFVLAVRGRVALGRRVVALPWRLAAIQDVLGSLNDALVSRHLVEELERYLADSPALGPSGAARGAGIILGWQAARIAEDRAKVTGVWKNFYGRTAQLSIANNNPRGVTATIALPYTTDLPAPA